ncbi:MAG TPA: hypothetical protein DD381_13080 [Lentisphaeria bacterium]|nr:MAG: hypothetical protein A2X47_11555 [Lentisphaerae bacterium GWF2_38_69]HBM17256.1 hypothetical protein [Lentisphaeria bacterium]
MYSEVIENPTLILKRLLAIYEVTPAELARKIGVHRATMLRIINGDIKKIKEEYFKSIAEYFSLTIDQIKGLKPIYWENIKGVLNLQVGRRIPIYSWQLDGNKLVPEIMDRTELTTLTDIEVSDNAFSLIIKDSIMEPLFPKGTIIICDPIKEVTNDAYVVVKLHNYNQLILRQILIDIDYKYLKALNKTLNASMRIMTPKDKILGVVVQSKYDFH